MTTHMIGTREEWLAARLDLLNRRPDVPACMSAFARKEGAVNHTEFYLCARIGRPLGHVSVARPRS